MKGKIAIISALLLALTLGAFGCGERSGAKQECLPTPGQTEQTEQEKIKYVYKTQYVDFAFITDVQKEAWRPLLVSLLNNKKTEIYEKGDGLSGFEVLYPDRPYIENGLHLGLFDFNTDGTPELLVNLGGGSACNAFYYVYDITTGQEIGALDGGFEDSWCIYFNRKTGEYEAIGQFEWRSGWMGKERFVHKATISDTMGMQKNYLHQSSWMYAYYEIDAVRVPVNEEDSEQGIEEAWDEIYTGVSFSVNGDRASIREYFDAQDDLTQNYVRIAETGICLVGWNEVTNEDDDVAERAEKIADALLSSKQKYVQPLPEE